MRKTLLATAIAAVAMASPAAARDGSPYLGIEGGILFPKDQDADIDIDFVDPLDGTDTNINNAFGIDYKRGLDLDAIVGYDFGPVRLEGELGWKRAKLDELEVSDDVTTLTGITDFDLDGKAKVLSGMVNLLADGEFGGFGVYAGAGVGRARVKFAGEKDSVWAGQLIAGARTALSENVDLGLKYRYFRTRKLDFGTSTDTIFDDAGVAIGTATTDLEQRFRSHSVLASLIFNFGAPEPAPVVVAPVVVAPVETPPAPPPPQTQTCPDGSVILATDVCPAPPPPPPPPVQTPERG